MIKKIAVVLMVLAFALSACSINGHSITFNSEHINGSGTIVTEDRSVNGFDKVDLQSIGNLTIIEGDKESLTIKADDNVMQYITSEVFNDTLEIGMEPNLSLDPSRDIEYTLTVKSLSSVVLSGFGNINAAELNAEDMEIKLSGSGNMTLGTLKSENALLRVSGFGNINVKEMIVDQPVLEISGSGDIDVKKLQAVTMNLKISGFGNADITGTTNDQEIQIVGSGNYHGQDLESEIASVKITGFGDATVWAKTNLDVTITGSGNLEYYGSPKVTQTMTGFGKVNSLGEH
ncbi:MAG: hypothetical protein C0410_00165 [Anaerolinea sp.]|nr:hypothetical protein [Anaerolinea sp.]